MRKTVRIMSCENCGKTIYDVAAHLCELCDEYHCRECARYCPECRVMECANCCNEFCDTVSANCVYK